MPAAQPSFVDPRRAGTSLLELLVALGTLSLLTAALCSLLITQLRVASSLTHRVEAAEAVRIAGAVLQGELRRGTPSDVRAAASDSLAIRAFRGFAIPCARAGATLHARFRGDRLPEPAKDSLLAVSMPAETAAIALLDVRAALHADCYPADGERILQLRLGRDPDSASVLLVFESGRYYVSNRALRYRLGAEGRQPLTAEVLLPGSRFEHIPYGGSALRLDTRAGGTIELPLRPAAIP